MLFLKRARARDNGQDASSFAPIVKVLTQMSEKDKDMLRVKFDIAHFVATQQLSFRDYPVLCQLEKSMELTLAWPIVIRMLEKHFAILLQSPREPS